MPLWRCCWYAKLRCLYRYGSLARCVAMSSRHPPRARRPVTFSGRYAPVQSSPTSRRCCARYAGCLAAVRGGALGFRSVRSQCRTLGSSSCHRSGGAAGKLGLQCHEYASRRCSCRCSGVEEMNGRRVCCQVVRRGAMLSVRWAMERLGVDVGAVTNMWVSSRTRRLHGGLTVVLIDVLCS
jgi:hypothetical protein